MSVVLKFNPGISVIVPTFQGASRLHALLDSLEEQTLNRKLFEVIFVLNGPDDGSMALLERFRSKNKTLNIRLLQSTPQGASRARNIGLASVTREYVTFLDDDDTIEPRYLEVGIDSAAPGVCGLLPIVDLVDGKRVEHNTLGIRIASMRGTSQLVRDNPWCLGFNASKVIPTDILVNYRYNEGLQSGEDVAFFAQLLSIPDLVVRVSQNLEGAAYLRTQRKGSVSRQKKTFDFNVTQRLETIRELRAVEPPEVCSNALKSLETAQFAFARAYLVDNPDQLEEAIALAMQFKLHGLDWGRLRKEKAKRLVVAYCFPPYADTSANVTAKVIANRGELVDVISANMSRVRKEDASTLLVVEPYIGRNKRIDVDPSFASWPLICSFARKSLKQAKKWSNPRGRYQSLYSRALWSGSHVAAALIKLEFPDLHWEAEFSDPLRFGVDGRLREGKITAGLITRRLRNVIKKRGWGDLEIPSHFALTEFVTFLLADELVFTNENQRRVMLAPYPLELQQEFESKSVVKPHALPSRRLFSLGSAQSTADPTKINIGYFGNFYRNRGIGEVVEALGSLDADIANRFVLHVYCNKPETVNRIRWEDGLLNEVRVYDYLPYLDFLATSDCLDVLLANDTDISESCFLMNPFLPSKYADYAASRALVWGIVTPGSPLSDRPLDFTSVSGNEQSIRETLHRIQTMLE